MKTTMCRSLVFAAVLFYCATLVFCASGPKCPVEETGNPGSYTSVQISIVLCTGDETCQVNQSEIIKTVENNRRTHRLELIINGFELNGQFFGDELCIAYRMTTGCETKCFTDNDVQTYEIGSVVNKIVKIEVTNRYTFTCPITLTGESGSEASAKLSLYFCTQASSSSQPACSPKPSVVKYLEKGETQNLNYVENSYSLTAKFFGKGVCVAFRKKTTYQDYRGYQFARTCETACFKRETIETYESTSVCSSFGCGGGKEKFKFVLSAKSVVVQVSYVLLISCSLLLLIAD